MAHFGVCRCPLTNLLDFKARRSSNSPKNKVEARGKHYEPSAENKRPASVTYDVRLIQQIEAQLASSGEKMAQLAIELRTYAVEIERTLRRVEQHGSLPG